MKAHMHLRSAVMKGQGSFLMVLKRIVPTLGYCSGMFWHPSVTPLHPVISDMKDDPLFHYHAIVLLNLYRG